MMDVRTMRAVALGAVAAATFAAPAPAGDAIQLRLESIGEYRTGIFDESAAEIVAHDPVLQRLYVVNGDADVIDVLDLSDPSMPTLVGGLDITPYGDGLQSVAVRDGIVACAVDSGTVGVAGSVVFFATDGTFLNVVTAGFLPDMVTFSPDGRWVLVANEGEPNDEYTIDPIGSISVIDLLDGVESIDDGDVRDADFSAFEGSIDSDVRIFGPGATVARDLEPEYIAVSADSTIAWASLQEANALAIIDIASATVTDVVALGFKDHSLEGNGFDASNDSATIEIVPRPTRGMYQPDAIATFTIGGESYVISANEGDARDYDGYSEEARVRDLVLDPTAFPNAAELQEDENLGRLKTTIANGDTDGDGDWDEIYSYGGRSFSIWNAAGELVYDSGDRLERIVLEQTPEFFNANNDDNDSVKSRSDDKGPEPEAVTTAVVEGRVFAFLGLERSGGVMTFDVTDPTDPILNDYVNTRILGGDPEVDEGGNLGPEGIVFIDAADSPIAGTALVVVANEVSGSTEVFRVRVVECADLVGDVNGDCRVNTADLLILLAMWGDCPPGGPCMADLDEDGVVGTTDLLLLLAAWDA